jgi:hypothetical protein
VTDFDAHITPEPSPDDEAAILAAVRQVLDRESSFVRPSMWRLAGWTGQRVGVRDLNMASGRRWVLSARMELGGRIFPGLNGRGDAK